MSLGHVEWVLFGWVLANQGGVPLPVVPILLAAGALAATGRLNIVEIGTVAMGATLCADLGWYAMGRWRGAGVLALLARLSPNAKAFVRRAQDAFLARPRRFQLAARFLPELNPVAAGLAGATGLGITRFVGCGVVSALIWTGTWIGVGYLLGNTVVDFALRYGIHLMGFLLAAMLLSLVVRRARRHHMLRMLQKARITPDELKARLERGERVTILDVRGDDEVAVAPHTLPGALWIRPDDLPRRLRDLPRDAMVVLYGRRLKRPKSGPTIPYANASVRVRPLAGGLPAWRRRGYPVQAADVGGR
ncbi:MAG TPA: rhodanese-like domain-containing protein [Methylomirabilota bacterium]|nr:rhodanese-like domain-containing protein [Methylomirabilota bacterium]